MGGELREDTKNGLWYARKSDLINPGRSDMVKELILYQKSAKS